MGITLPLGDNSGRPRRAFDVAESPSLDGGKPKRPLDNSEGDRPCLGSTLQRCCCENAVTVFIEERHQFTRVHRRLARPRATQSAVRAYVARFLDPDEALNT